MERIRMVKLPFSWSGYFLFCIFDQFSQCVRRIDIKTPNSVLIDLTYHLSCSAHRLLGIQRRLGSPLCFHNTSTKHATVTRLSHHHLIQMLRFHRETPGSSL